MRTQKFHKFAKLLVYWEDIVSESEWKDKDKLKKAKTEEVHTMGFYICTEKRTLKVAHSLCPADEQSDVTCIPWGTITKIEELEVKNDS